jgi:alpha-L-arabinofuranosidase
MRHVPIRSALPATRLVAVALAGSTALTLAIPTLGATAQAAARHRPGTTITVLAGNPRGQVPVHQLGVNHRFVSEGHGMWDPATNQPVPRVMDRLRAAGVNAIRYPGGIVGNLFDWKKAIDRPDLDRFDRGCQTHGQWTPEGFGRVRGNHYGVDEHMEVTEKLGAEAIMMIPSITETPGDAADWVEYMNSPDDGPNGKNPNSGTDWAYVRGLNDHPRPYNVRWWEVGNEQRVIHQRYWMSRDKRVALHQYANGAKVAINNEMLGRNCFHFDKGSRSSGNPGQVFELLYTPAQNVSVQVLSGTGQVLDWTEAPLAGAGPNDHVFEVNPSEGTVRFGNGSQGAVLPKGLKVRASYLSVHPGVFSFIKRMREVDPSIKACVTWGLLPFVKVAGNRKYNCFSVHAYTHFGSEGVGRWQSPIDGHDQHMLGTERERHFVSNIKRALPRNVAIALTEFGTLRGDRAVYPEWAGSMTHATYMASMWVNWINLGIPLAAGSDMLAKKDRAVLGPAPDFAMSAEALTREAIKPLFVPSSRKLGVKVVGNPVRHPSVRNADSYRSLAVVATRTHKREVRLLVVNRHPSAQVRARVDLRGFASRRVAFVSRVNGASFRSRNTARVTEVHLRSDRQRIKRGGFVETFPAHSVTVIRVPAGRR